MILSNGDVRDAVKLYNVFVLILFLSIVYLYLSRYLKKEAVILGTVSISFVPWIFGLFTTFNSEVSFVTTALALFVSFESQFSVKIKKVCFGFRIAESRHDVTACRERAFLQPPRVAFSF